MDGASRSHRSISRWSKSPDASGRATKRFFCRRLSQRWMMRVSVGSKTIAVRGSHWSATVGRGPEGSATAAVMEIARGTRLESARPARYRRRAEEGRGENSHRTSRDTRPNKSTKSVRGSTGAEGRCGPKRARDCPAPGPRI